jgi:tetratricopeptide (TPR) repeat protein
MKKAFLCHSSDDKEYVDIIAKYLGRSHIVYDKNNFKTGNDFRSEIIRGLQASGIFIFFVSKKSLASSWCKYEIDKAEMLKIKGKIKKCLCIIIDRDVSYKETPSWMQDSKILIQPKPSLAYRDIIQLILEFDNEFDRSIFIGRDDYKTRLKNIVSDYSEERKHIFVLSGLDGIGKKEIYNNTLPLYHDLKSGPYYFLDENKTLEDLYIMLIQDTMTSVFDKNVYLKEIELFRSASETEKISKLSNKLIEVCSDGFLPCIIDYGTLLNEDGTFKNEFLNIIKTVINSGDYYICVHERRSPKLDNIIENDYFIHLKVNPLEATDIKVILGILFKRNKIETIESKLNELVKYIDGYPPAVYFTLGYIKEYGIDVLINDKTMLSDFKAKRFAKFITELKIDETCKKLLRYLVGESFLPIEVIGSALNISLDKLSLVITKLIDLSLITHINNQYGISRPIKEAISRTFGLFKKEEYDNVALQLTKEYWSTDNEAPYLAIVDATINSVARSSNKNIDEYESFFRVSTLKKVAKESYYRQEWKSSIDYSIRGLKLNKNDIEFDILILKSFAKLEEWGKAFEQLKKIHEIGHKHYHYLEGFVFKAQHKYREAINSFEQAIAIGDSYYPVYRDYSDCLFRIKEYSHAFNYINKVLDLDAENIFILELAIRICIELNDYAKANELLQQLERCDLENKFFYLRKATYLAKIHDWSNALSYINRAAESKSDYFEILYEKANILIELKKYDEARAILEFLREKYQKQRNDIQLGLWSKYFTRLGKYREAIECQKGISDKTSPFYLASRANTLSKIVNDISFSSSEKETAEKELAYIKTSLGSVKEVTPYDIYDEAEVEE